ncbi:MAG TPA: sulfite exporter TauE/SafE family protein [Ignavibacteria bacterium]|jgi:hypothetical protein
MWFHIFFIVLGFIFGTFGTLVGAGGGFILMPVLLLLFPDVNPEVLTSISLAVVFFNASSGSIAYSRMKKIDYKSGLIFAAAAVPGAVLGSLSIKFINRDVFNVIFGLLLIAVSVYLFFKPQRTVTKIKANDKLHERKVIDSDNIEYVYSFNGKIGVLLSAAIGYVSSLLGIGGGIIHVPAMVNILNFPVHIATATSHFVLAIIALAGTVARIFEGSFTKESIIQVLFLSAGVIAGAQLGARLSKRIHGKWILKGLAIALCFVGIRILFMSL